METLKELYKIGRGPSSSHTLAPERACRLFVEKEGPFPYYQVSLYGSLSLTGKGHETDRIIKETLGSPCDVSFEQDWEEDFPNGFRLSGLDEERRIQKTWTVFSLGGGSIQVKEYPIEKEEVYEESSFQEILETLKKEDTDLISYIYSRDPGLKEYLCTIVEAMSACVKTGLSKEGILPGRLKISRKAKMLNERAGDDERLKLMAYAYAACEENADHGTCVTAPTLGSCGVLASMIHCLYEDRHISKEKLADGLAVGGIFGDLIKQNATLSGAVGGCQAEVGAAVSMAAAAYAYLEGLSLNEIEYAAEIGMEHHLGLTCDPVMGYVQIPCIERNAVAVLRAIDAVTLSRAMSDAGGHMISFDMVVKTMNETGKKIPIEFRETSTGGLAREYLEKEDQEIHDKMVEEKKEGSSI